MTNLASEKKSDVAVVQLQFGNHSLKQKLESSMIALRREIALFGKKQSSTSIGFRQRSSSLSFGLLVGKTSK